MDNLQIKEPLFKCTVKELQDAVHAVGTSATKVQAYLH